MQKLRNERKLVLSITPLYKLNEVSFKHCFLNARSLHKHFQDICSDLNFCSSDVSIFAETRFCNRDSNDMFTIPGYMLYTNDKCIYKY